MSKRFWVFLTVIIVLGLGAGAWVFAQSDSGVPTAGDENFPAPDFPVGLDWLNVSQPLTLEDLRGKVVILDFWTYGCINCIHMIPTLARLEAEYADELVVIGVHSAKFDNEGITENIREIVQRYEIHHPVINDSAFAVWNTWRPYGVNAWPTFAVIDPRGNILAVQSGEIPYEAFDRVLSGMVAYFDTQGELNRDPITTIQAELDSAPARALNYPGKVLVDEEGGRLFIADSVNHRIVIASLDDYTVQHVIGTGEAGYADGDFAVAQFYKPQGLALRGDVLYVADTFNHAIRAVHLSDTSVTTVGGTGIQGRGFPSGTTFPALTTDIRSPWDLEFGDDENLLYVAMAGTHQLWTLDLVNEVFSFAVGNGREAQLNRSLQDSELAQPSGLFWEADRLYFADSESSTIRVADFNEDSVAVVSGTTENSLFDFGDIDGELGTNRLQHALDVVGDGNGTLYIADTYNSKIKRVDQATLVTTTLSADQAGYADGDLATARFYEPGGLDYADGKLYVADTNNHAIRVIDLASGTVETVRFSNPEALQMNGQATVIAANSNAMVLPSQQVQAGAGEVILTVTLPDGYKINDLAPSVARFQSDGAAIQLDAEATTQPLDVAEVRVPATFTQGDGFILGEFDLYYCEAVNESLCFIEQFAVELPVEVVEQSTNTTLSISHTVTPVIASVGELNS
ncbi:MAG: thioredoxin-like domain-containing protein [Phototrophicaceae bacterium]